MAMMLRVFSGETAIRLLKRQTKIMMIMWFALEGIDHFAVFGIRMECTVIYPSPMCCSMQMGI
jgi:hypothetical protein